VEGLPSISETVALGRVCLGLGFFRLLEEDLGEAVMAFEVEWIERDGVFEGLCGSRSRRD
jgi:hypothetical protein